MESTEKKKRAVKSRTNEELASSGLRGKLVVLAKFAFSLGNKNNFEGTKLAGKQSKKVKKEDGTISTVSPYNSPLYAMTKDGKGRIFLIDEKGEMFQNILKTAKACKDDVTKGTYSDKVKKFIDAFIAPVGVSMGGTRTMNTSVLSGMEL
jgi:hypothetical protein